MLGRTSGEADAEGGGSSTLSKLVLDTVVQAKGGKKLSTAQTATAIASLINQRLRSSADQCPPLVQSVLQGLRLVIELLATVEAATLERQMAEKEKRRRRRKAGGDPAELSFALRVALLGTVDQLQHFKEGLEAEMKMLQAVAAACAKQLRKVDERGTENLAVFTPRDTIAAEAHHDSLRDSAADDLQRAERMSAAWAVQNLEAGLDPLRQAELVDEFMVSTGGSAADASHFLHAGGWDLIAATDAYYDGEERRLMDALGLQESQPEPEPEPEPETEPEPEPETAKRLTSFKQRLTSLKSGSSHSSTGSMSDVGSSPTVVGSATDRDREYDDSWLDSSVLESVLSSSEISARESALLARVSSGAGLPSRVAAGSSATVAESGGAGLWRLNSVLTQYSADKSEVLQGEARRAEQAVGQFLQERGDGETATRVVAALHTAQYPADRWMPELRVMEQSGELVMFLQTVRVEMGRAQSKGGTDGS